MRAGPGKKKIKKEGDTEVPIFLLRKNDKSVEPKMDHEPSRGGGCWVSQIRIPQPTMIIGAPGNTPEGVVWETRMGVGGGCTPHHPSSFRDSHSVQHWVGWAWVRKLWSTPPTLKKGSFSGADPRPNFMSAVSISKSNPYKKHKTSYFNQQNTFFLSFWHSFSFTSA